MVILHTGTRTRSFYHTIRIFSWLISAKQTTRIHIFTELATICIVLLETANLHTQGSCTVVYHRMSHYFYGEKEKGQEIEKGKKKKREDRKKIAEHDEHSIHTQVKNSPPGFDF